MAMTEQLELKNIPLPEEILELDLPSEVLAQLVEPYDDCDNNHFTKNGYRIDHDDFNDSKDIGITNDNDGIFFNINVIQDPAGFEIRELTVLTQDDMGNNHSKRLFFYYLTNGIIQEVTLL